MKHAEHWGLLVRVLRLDDRALREVPRVAAALARDAVALKEPAVEPDGRVERRGLRDEQVQELRLEGVGVLLAREVVALLLAGLADRTGDAVDELLDGPLAALRVAVDARLAEVLGDGDVGRELRPRGRHLDAAHLEDDRAVRVRDDRVAQLVGQLVERVDADAGVPALERNSRRASRKLPGGRGLRGGAVRHIALVRASRFSDAIECHDAPPVSIALLGFRQCSAGRTHRFITASPQGIHPLSTSYRARRRTRPLLVVGRPCVPAPSVAVK